MNEYIKPDIIAEVKLLGAEEGGLQKPIASAKVGCIFSFKDEDFSCFLLPARGFQLFPGSVGIVSIKFVYPHLLNGRLTGGDSFALRDYREFGRGRVIEVFMPSNN